MVRRTETRFVGHDCYKLENDALALWVTRSVGPRILGLALQDSPASRSGSNLFAELPGVTIDCPGEGPFLLRGGHRLWVAPEDPRRTYLPDDEPPAIRDIERGLHVLQPIPAQTGIEKALAVTLPGQDARVVVEHVLCNHGSRPVELAPWAITQLKPGGVAILPQPAALADEYGLLPNRHLVLWPYTQMNSRHVSWGDRFLFVTAAMQTGAFKIGFPNPAGWLAYAVDGTLFVKQAAYRPGAAYFDRGSSSECYCNPRFLELETLGPRTCLAPGETVTHRETWQLYAVPSFRPDEATMQIIAGELGLAMEGSS